MRIVLLVVSCLLLSACDRAAESPSTTVASPVSNDQASASGTQLPTITLSPAFTGLTFIRPVFLTHAGDGSNRLFVIEQPGRIRVFENEPDVTSTEVFLDIKDAVHARHNEEGLLALAFHPQYETNGRLFVYYTASNPRRGVVSEFQVSETNPDRADPDSEKVILEVEQPWGNHNGSMILFGPDGYLYISLGDGGAANDPRRNGQDLSTLLATILRIDVDQTDDNKAYAVPDDNPFVDRDGAQPEIWAYGLRNVWRMSFDRKTDNLWAGDVGQNKWEEIDLITKGGNYGWRIREGKHPFAEGEPPEGEELIDPVVEYGRRDGISITGGYVYRGQAFPELQGVYVYADYGTGNIWGLRYKNGQVLAHKQIGGKNKRIHITSFGEDAAGELFACGFRRYDGRKGRLYRVRVR